MLSWIGRLHTRTSNSQKMLKEVPSWLRITQRVAKPRVVREEPRSGPVWERLVDAARNTGHVEPEKLATSMLRTREAALKLQKDRPCIQVTTLPPKAREAVVQAPKSDRKVIHDAHRCKALTLEGRRCPFKCQGGDFCKKHHVVTKI